jgi:uncharacterized membrane protein
LAEAFGRAVRQAVVVIAQSLQTVLGILRNPDPYERRPISTREKKGARMGIIRGPKPDITPAQIISGIPILATLLQAFGVYSATPEQVEALTSASTWALGLLGADAAIRIGRNYANGKTQAAALSGSPRLEPATMVGSAGVINLGSGDTPDDLPSDDEEFASPPPDASNMPVQPSQVHGVGHVREGDEFPPAVLQDPLP